ncbi:MAG: SDR family oxidoreductase [Acidimicrobiaceae bacterium]|nr:SDR family oxidoreductase [Acidimicrobiaceae bacterium]MXY10533.1 SDR family oxidoreductase [Acidimicrobiaceae bacterium]MXZ64859.1 SDR family oxidoreductase [Acidimicrobiaceae bacterium]MYE66021.1 SDR family oxidoreductase [Acidimicrobiaceae bacterium]MYF33080.1 SDR family oxidoreductase [Acidimicrobiaceae bacterium]
MELPGRVALVTGGAHRVGRAIALALAAAGSNVAIAYHRSREQAASTVGELQDCGVDADAFEADLAQPAEAARLATEVADRLGPVDALINSASWFATDEFPTADTETWYQTFDVVLHGPFHLTNAVAGCMLERGGGAVVNVVDLSAWQPWPGRAAHSVAKAALLALTRQVAVELAPTVRCNAVALGPTIEPAKFGPDQVERLRRRTLLGRWAGGAEAGRAVQYLLEAEAVTGECLTVDGGEQYGHVRQRFTDTTDREGVGTGR